MKTISVVSSSELIPSSAVDVVISNDDLFVEILLRLPAFSLRVFKTVSKRWLTLITNPNFTLRRSRNPILDPPSGLFIPGRETPFKYDFVPLNINIPSPKTTFSLGFDSDHKVEIMQSCNGLILCGNMSHDHELLYVYNPSTNRFKTIPKPPLRESYHFIDASLFSKVSGFRMAFDPSKSHHYKIVYAELAKLTRDDDHLSPVIQVHIYSSETCNWSVCRNPFPRFLNFKGFSKGIYWNGGIHWLNKDVFVDHMLDVDVEHPELKSIQTPQKSPRKLFESNGCLFLLCSGPYGLVSLSIYEMSKRCSLWSVKCIVTLDVLKMKYELRICRARPSDWFLLHVQCIVIEKNEEGSFLVLEIDGEIIKYKIASKTISKIYQLSDSSPSWVDSFAFIASFAGV